MDTSDIVNRVIGFYSAEILSVYQGQPEKYDVNTDYFTGEVKTTDSFFSDSSQYTGRETIGVQFGFHERKTGELALAVYLPDLATASEDERKKWVGFRLAAEELSEEPDRRFRLWVKVLFEGSWDEEEPILARMRRVVGEINAVTTMVVNEPLFKLEDNPAMRFPNGQTDHAYQDAHSETYKFLIDGLNKAAITAVGASRGITLRLDSDRTLAALKEILDEPVQGAILVPLNKCSEQRRLADHQVRSPARRFSAFEKFREDAEEIAVALEILRDELARQFNVTVESCLVRHTSLKFLPRIDPTDPVCPHYSIWKVTETFGKTITSAKIGFAEKRADSPQREVIILHFSDGSSLGIEMASNLGQILDSKQIIRIEDCHLSFALTAVPALRAPTVTSPRK